MTWTDVARNGLHAKSSEVYEARQDEVLSNARFLCKWNRAFQAKGTRMIEEKMRRF